MNPGITAIVLCHNLEKIKYPWKHSINSVLPGVDEFVLIDAFPHDDNTSEEIERLAKSLGKPVTIYKDFWPVDHTGLSSLVNSGIDTAETEWVMQLQADEIYPEWQLGDFEKIKELPSYIQAASVQFKHFIGDYFHTFPFMYQRVIRVIRKSSNFRFVGDAAEAVGIGGVCQSELTAFHVGKIHVGRESAGAFKEYRFQKDLYEGRVFDNADPLIVKAYERGKINYFEVFRSTIIEGKMDDYSGPWPKEMKVWALENGVEL